MRPSSLTHQRDARNFSSTPFAASAVEGVKRRATLSDTENLAVGAFGGVLETVIQSECAFLFLPREGAGRGDAGQTQTLLPEFSPPFVHSIFPHLSCPSYPCVFSFFNYSLIEKLDRRERRAALSFELIDPTDPPLAFASYPSLPLPPPLSLTRSASHHLQDLCAEWQASSLQHRRYVPYSLTSYVRDIQYGTTYGTLFESRECHLASTSTSPVARERKKRKTHVSPIHPSIHSSIHPSAARYDER